MSQDLEDLATCLADCGVNLNYGGETEERAKLPGAGRMATRTQESVEDLDL